MDIDYLDNILQDSFSVTSSRPRLISHNNNQQQQQSSDLSSFREEVELNYRQSVANQIYSFPILIQNCSSFVSSDDSSLQNQQIYDLNDQNKKHKHLAIQMEEKRVKYQKSKIEIEHKKDRMKRHIRNQSTLAKRKYQHLIDLMNKSLSPVKGKSIQNIKIKKDNKKQKDNSEQRWKIIQRIQQKQRQRQKEKQKQKQKQKYYMYLDSKDRNTTKQGISYRQTKAKNKSQRLRTQPDESIKGTFRKKIGDVKKFNFYN